MNTDDIGRTHDGFDPEDHKPLTMNSIDDCIVGVVERVGAGPVLCYDADKVIAKNMDDGMTYDEAVGFFERNQLGAYVGEGTPCFLHTNEQTRVFILDDKWGGSQVVEARAEEIRTLINSLHNLLCDNDGCAWLDLPCSGMVQDQPGKIGIKLGIA